MRTKNGVCDPMKTAFMMFVPHDNHPQWRLSGCNETRTNCLTMVRQREVEMGIALSKTLDGTDKNDENTPELWLTIIMVLMCISITLTLLTISWNYLSRIQLERIASKKDIFERRDMSDWYLNPAAKAYIQMTSLMNIEKEGTNRLDYSYSK